jgi:DNA-3-methyladenine glycosylase
MYGDAAHVYVYFTYGMHWCANIVCGAPGDGQAVLLRAAVPLGGIEAMRAARGGVADRDLCRGPARLAQALGLSGADNGAALVVSGRGRVAGWRDGAAGRGEWAAGRGERAAGRGDGGDGVAHRSGLVIALLDDGVGPPGEPGVGPRVGITKAVDVPWRWWVPGSPWVSAFKPGGPRRRGAKG